MHIKLRSKSEGALRKQQQREVLKWLWALPIALIALLLYIAGPKVMSAIDKFDNPPLRTDVEHHILLSHSKSDATMRPLISVAEEVLVLDDALRSRLGPIRTVMQKFSSKPVDLYDGPNEQKALLFVLTNHYIDSNPDPVPGTLLAPALKKAFDNASPSACLIFTIGTDAWEDTGAVRKLLMQAQQQGRKFIVLVHGVPLHNVKLANTQKDLRSLNKQSLTPVKERAFVCSKHEFPSAVARWLPEQLRKQKLIED